VLGVPLFPVRVLVDAFITLISWCLGMLVPKSPTLVVVGGRQFGGNTRPVLERATEVGLTAVWLTGRREILALGRPDVVSTRSLRGLMVASRAKTVLLTHSLGDFAPLRFPRGDTLIFNLWHGMPIKRISAADPGFLERSHTRSNLREMKRYSAMLATSPRMAELFALTFGLPLERILVTGQPRTDVILSGAVPSLSALFEPPLVPFRKAILYCPTWREGEAVQLFPFPSRNLEALERRLEELDAIMFVRTHPNDAGRLTRASGRLVPLGTELVPEITEVLAAFDVLVTDYSSIYYDFLLLDRPVIFIPYDLEAYARSPGFYLPFHEIAAGPCVATQEEFEEELVAALQTRERDRQARARVRELVYSHVDADAATRVLRFIADGCNLFGPTSQRGGKATDPGQT